jgi:virulence factor Mce-like protein
MLSRFVRTQLIIFAIASVIGVATMAVVYMQAPTLLSIGRITVKLQLPDTGALYRFSNVTVRGVQLGKVTDVSLTDEGAVATLSLATAPRVPTDLVAQVKSLSAVGEQYVDLLPRKDSGPYLTDDSMIAAKDVVLPQAVGPMLDQVSSLLESVPKERISSLLDESFKALDGADYDLGSLIDSSAKLSADLNSVGDRTRTLVDDSVPLLDGQRQSANDIRTWTRRLAGFTEQLAQNDPQVRSLLQRGPGTADEVSALLNQLKPTLPVLLANLTSVGQVTMMYRPGIEQLLVLLPPYVAAEQSLGLPWNNPTGMSLGDFNINIGDPPVCTAGFLPPSSWRSPADTSDIDTPEGLYCKLPQDSPIAVRGARNSPCPGQPGKRAPTAAMCRSDKPFEPLAMHPHALGPYAFDPNLIAQGIPPDDRTNFHENIYGPLEGTPLPADPGTLPAAPVPGASPAEVPPPASAPPPTELPPPAESPSPIEVLPSADVPPAPPIGVTPTGPPPGAVDPAVAPSAFHSSGGPSVAAARYDPDTGRFITADGQVLRQTNLVTHGAAMSWQQLLPTA